MREMPLPETGPKRKLFDAAARLFAERGFDSVSVRDICGLTGANIAAVNYHFGSRDGLLTLVTLSYLQPLIEERLARLDGIERKGAKGMLIEEVIEAFVRPLLTQVRKVELPEELYFKIVGRVFSAQGSGLPGPVNDLLGQASDRFIRAFGKTLPALAGDEVQCRYHFMAGGLVHLLTLPPPSAAGSMESALGRFTRFAAAGMRDGLEVGAEAKAGPQAMFDF